MNSDFKDLLQSLLEEQAEFLVVGGYAVIFHAEPRFTKDIDILVGSELENARRVYEALKKFGAPVSDITPGDLCLDGNFFQIGLPPNRVDIIATIPGVNFKDAYQRRDLMKIGAVGVPVICRSDLIDAKLAAGRPQDLVDAGILAKSKPGRKQ